MKRNFKAFLTILSAVALVVVAAPSKALAAADVATLTFMDGSYGNGWWGEGNADNGAGVTAVEAEVNGPGQYTVSLNFEGTEAGVAQGCQFIAPMILGAEERYKDFVLQIDSVKVNGVDQTVGTTYTSCDADGKNNTRVNLFNQWDTDPTKADNNPRTVSGSLDGISATPLDITGFVDVKEISVTFTVVDPNAAVVEETPAEEVTTEETTEAEPTTEVPKTGVVGLGLVYGLGALATGAAALKRKQK